ncbi:Predicted L-lactate dehydrogenase, Fe-S oxidoreductase subunit YkgE [hydrothermal vent metagenome]|uniref:Predicted L-lactate dehydrogenase, Fe-S oxidoreductase subunit YkgE n=1 Tax=hydrothermal vent metagenome TaxID=652676 RepID=A0A3B0TCG7_9ZZZZ
MEVNLFIPCFIDQMYPDTAFSIVKVLEKSGVSVSYNPEQTCCGQPSFNSGYWKETKILAQKFIHDFRGGGFIVSPSASCTGFIRNYYEKLFKDDEKELAEVVELKDRIFEFTDFLVNKLKISSVGAKFPYKITYHDSCAALREYGIKSEPRVLLENVEGLELIEMEDTETCCGFGGTFAAKFKTISTAMSGQKVSNALATGAEYIVSTDSSCLLNIESYIRKQRLPIKTIHIADVLAAGY